MTGCWHCRHLEMCVCGGVAELLTAPAPEDGQDDDDTEYYRPAAVPVAGA